MTSPMQVPPRARGTLAHLANTPTTFADRLPVSPDGPVVASPEDLSRHLSQVLEGWSFSQAEGLVRELFSIVISMSNHGRPASQTAAELAADENLEIEQDQREQLEQALTVLLESPEVLNVSNAAAVFGDADRIFHAARSGVDIKPVFTGSDEMAGAVVLRKLRLTYFDEGKIKDLDLIVEPSDIAEIRTVLTRLEVEATAASTIVGNSGMMIFSFDEASNGDD